MCPPGHKWFPNGKSCYRFYKEKKTWNDAKTICARDYRDSSLAVIKSEEVNNFLLDRISDDRIARKSKKIWIGGFQTKGSEEPDHGWTWVDGTSISFTYWSWQGLDVDDRIDSRHLHINDLLDFADIRDW